MEISRRRVVGWGVGAMTVGITGVRLATVTQGAVAQTPVGNDTATWGPDTAVTVTGPVVLARPDVSVASLTIAPSGSVTFKSDTNVTLRSRGSVIVQGRLVMRPSTPSVRHLVQFTGASESAFQGGGMPMTPSQVPATDVGLWVIGSGLLDAQGSKKLAWTRAAGSLAAGARSITLLDIPGGWQVGDELAILPTRTPTPEDDPSHQVSLVKIAAIDLRTVTLSGPLQSAHPAVNLGRGKSLTAEVLNLTRNVGIEGVPSKRSHVFVHTPPPAGRPQTIKYVALRHLGPTQGTGEHDAPNEVLGRYGIHFHHCQEGSRGSVLEGLVGRNLGSHAFVPHESNGTTWRDCISYETNGAAYWWDPEDNATDVLFERCVAANVESLSSEVFQTCGFLLGKGPRRRNTVRDCVAANIFGDGDGFLWYGGDATWVFEDNVAHNCTGHGVRVWQNNSLPHVVTRTICYHNDISGIDHGAYGNAWQYLGGHMVGNGSVPIKVRAVSHVSDENQGLTFADLYIDAAGEPAAMLITDGSPVDPDRATMVRNCEFRGYSQAGIIIEANGHDAEIQIVDCTFCGNELWLENGVGSGSRLALSDSVHGDAVVAPAGQPGTPVPDWNAAATGLKGRSSGQCADTGGAGGGGASGSSGYFLLESDGDIYAFGAARPLLRSWDRNAAEDESRSVTISKILSSAVGGAAVVAAASSDRGGLWTLLTDGRILDLGPATPAPGVNAAALTKQVAGRPEAPAALARVGSGDLWVFTTAGRVIPQFGRLPSTVTRWMDLVLGRDLFGPIISAQPTVDGTGAYAIGSDGGVFTYNSTFLGSVYDAIAKVHRVPVGAIRPDQPIVGITVDPDGNGYWLVGADGGVFTFDSPFRGSLPAIVPFENLFAPVTDMVPFGNGYLLLGADGGVFNFSNQPFSGSASLLADTPITAIATIS